MKNNLARARAKGEQLFIPLGHCRGRLYFRAHGSVWWWTSGDICRLGAALALRPDILHWRTLYPVEGGKVGAVDWERAGADLIRLAQEAGRYTPEPGDGPTPPGRPRLSAEEKSRRKEDGDAHVRFD